MKKEIINHLIYLISYFIFITVVNSFYSLNYWPFWVGGMIGVFMPYLDHLLFVFVLKPYELTSQRVKYLIETKQIKESLRLLYDTRGERLDLLFHSVGFQIIFAILTFWIATSSGNLFGKGVTFGFFLSLFIHTLKKYLNKEIILEDYDKSRIYFFTNIFLLIIFALLI